MYSSPKFLVATERKLLMNRQWRLVTLIVLWTCVSFELSAEEPTSSERSFYNVPAPSVLESTPFATASKEGAEGAESSERRESGSGEKASERLIPLYAVFDDGFSLKSVDDQFQLRIRTLTQIDGKGFLPSTQEPARSGMYIPRFRIYLEGQLTEVFEYELSLQRSVEGTFDVLDANVNFVRSEAFKVRVGRALVPYSFAW